MSITSVRRRAFLASTLAIQLWRSTANAEAARSIDVTIPAGSVRLAARLYLPSGLGPFPALVFTHGSGPSGRDSSRYQEEAEHFTAAGIACLTYDKRGYGASTGDWKTAAFDDLALDAIAAVQYLRSRSDIDRKRIGIRGASQSGWVLPLAASHSADIAFLVLISPPAVSPYEQVLYNVRADLEDAGLSPPDVEKALQLTRSGLDYARTWKGWPEHRKRLDAASKERWVEIASGPRTPDDWLWKWIHPLIDFDVLPTVRHLKIPVLVLLGEQDREVPSQVSGYLLQQALSGSPHALVRYFPDGDHDLRNTKASKANGRAPLVTGYVETITEWVLERQKPDA